MTRNTTDNLDKLPQVAYAGVNRPDILQRQGAETVSQHSLFCPSAADNFRGATM